MILAATIALALILVGAGLGAERLAAGRVSPDIEAPAYALIAGWAILALVALACALFGARLTLPVTAVGLFGLAGYLLSPRNAAIVLRLVAAWLVVAPLLLIASTTSPFMADEFTHWLPNTRFLLERDSFSAAADPNIWSGAPGYPPAVPLIGYAIGRSAGSGSELAPKIFCVLLAAGFGLLLAGTLRRRLPSIAAIAAGVAFATVLNPFFDPRLAFTRYADVPSGFVLAFCVQACWQATENPDRHTALRSSATAILLVLLRETNIVLLAGLAAGLLLMGRRGWWPFVGLSVPGGSAFVLWRFARINPAYGTPAAARRVGLDRTLVRHQGPPDRSPGGKSRGRDLGRPAARRLARGIHVAMATLARGAATALAVVEHDSGGVDRISGLVLRGGIHAPVGDAGELGLALPVRARTALHPGVFFAPRRLAARPVSPSNLCQQRGDPHRGGVGCVSFAGGIDRVDA